MILLVWVVASVSSAIEWRLCLASDQVKSVGVQQRAMVANSKLASAMGSAASTMSQANKAMDPQKMAQTLKQFEQESMKMGMTEEMGKLSLS